MLALATPLWLLALPVPLLWWLGQHWWRRRATQAPAQAALLHPHATRLAQLQAATQRPTRFELPWLWLLGCSALVVALARPVWLLPTAPDSRLGRDILLAVDTSGSMRAEDFVIDGQPANRLAMLKRVVDGFLAQRQGDRIGLLVFGDDAYTVAPLTPDIDLVRRLLADLEPGIAGEKTALGTALALASERLQSGSGEKVLVLFTDGSNTAGNIAPEQALETALQQGVRIYSVGIGSHNAVPFPRAVLQTPALTEMPLNEALLQRLAGASGGRYFLGSRSEDMTAIVSEIDRIERLRREDILAAPRYEAYWLPLLLGLLLLYLQQSRRAREVAP